MCLIIVAINQVDNYPLVFLSNRDEFYQRPTKSMHWWKDEDVLAGKDLQAGGTWLAINSQQQFAAVTNYRDLEHNDPNAPSRRAIPIDLIKHPPEDFKNYVKNHQELWDKMNGFNLIYYTGHFIYYYSSTSKEVIELQDGIYVIS